MKNFSYIVYTIERNKDTSEAEVKATRLNRA